MRKERWFPGLVLGLAAVGLALSLAAPRREGPDLRGFARLPALEGGRVKPLDTIARSSLLMLRGRQSLSVEGRRLEPIEWLLEVLARPEAADAYRIFVIDDPELLGLLGRGRGAEKYFAFWELEPHLQEIGRLAAGASGLEAAQRSRFQAAVSNFHERLAVYQRLKNSLQVAGTQDLAAELGEYRRAIPAGVRAVAEHQGSGPFDRKALEALNRYFQRYQFLSQAAFFSPVPPLEGESPQGWTGLGDGLLGLMRQGPESPAVEAYSRMVSAYRKGNREDFSQALAGYVRWLDLRLPRIASRARSEALFNRASPFTRGMTLYLAALLLSFASWLFWRKALEKSAFWLILLAFGVHTAGLAARMILQGRPPVTNLYSSAVFVGWVAVLLGILLERLSRRGFGSVAAGAAGFASLIVAHNLTGSGDTIEMMRAVLDSNFWLATHVVTITIGYGATFVASLLAHLYILRGLLAALDEDSARSLGRMTYGVVCFSLFFSFLGTVLGGIWADQSWGRFWGWDPKENGALLIVLWNAIILHARWGGYARERGLMLMAVFGGIVTSLSWFGVNMLGVGLHSYGFMDKAFYALSGFVLAEIGVMALGSLPARTSLKAEPSQPVLPQGIP